MPDLPAPPYLPHPHLKPVPSGPFQGYWISPGRGNSELPQVWSWGWSNRCQTRGRWHQIAMRRRPESKREIPYYEVRVKRQQPDGTYRCHTTHLHRLTMLAHGGKPPEPGMIVRHLDTNSVCPSYYNELGTVRLAWGTYKDNVRDMLELHRTACVGEASPFAKLSIPDVLEILDLYMQGQGYERLARRFEVHPKLVWEIVQGKRWRAVPRPPGLEDMCASRSRPFGTSYAV